MVNSPSPMHRALILTALSIEYKAVRAHLTQISELTHPEGTVYEQGMFSGGGRAWQVAIVETDAGNEGAAMECERAIRTFQPGVVMMVGVAGGIKDVVLYDVVVADKVYGYDFGKVSSTGFDPRPDVSESDYALIQRARSEAKKSDWLTRLNPPSEPSPTVHVGAIAAGNKVIASTKSQEYQMIRSRFGDALAVEMEGRGILTAGHANPSVKSIVIRGISDMIDDKNAVHSDAFAVETETANPQEVAARQDAERQRVAAHHASAFAFEMLAKLDPSVLTGGGRPLPLPTSYSVSPSQDRLNRLDRLYRASRARCIEKWQATGVLLEQAKEFAADPSIQMLNPPQVQVGKVLLLLGEQGTGKSLTAERAFQQAIIRAKEDTTAPIPVFLYAPDIIGPLEQAITTAMTDLGNPQAEGVFIVIDGADEAGMDRAEALFKEARVCVQSWPKATVILTSRPLPFLSCAEEKVDMSLLSVEAAYDLIGRVADCVVDPYITRGWPESVRDALLVPLFALFIGVRLRRGGIAPLGSLAELMAGMIEDSLQGTAQTVRQATDALQDLARRSLDRGGSVPVAEFPQPVREILLSSRLVIERQRTLAFALRVHAEWFGTQCLRSGTPGVEALVEDFARLDRWRYAIIMAAHVLSREQVAGMLALLAARHPGFAAQVIQASDSERTRFWQERATTHLSAQECGEHIHAAMRSWVEGIGAQAPLFSPVRTDGQVRSVGTRIDGESLSVSWYMGEEAKPDVVVLPPELVLPTNWWNGWPSVSTGVVTQPEALWAWSFTLAGLSRNLNKMLSTGGFIPPLGTLRHEMVWRMALDMAHRGEYNTDPIPLNDIESMLNSIPADAALGVTSLRMYSVASLNVFREEVQRLRDRGATHLLFPYPAPDIDLPGRVTVAHWELYSDERMMALIRDVYTAALEGYAQLVITYFPKFAFSLKMYSLLPVKMVGMFRPPDRGWPRRYDNDPWLGRFMDALPSGNQNMVDVQPGNLELLEAAAEQAAERHKYLRPPYVSDGGVEYTTGSPDVFGAQPATRIAYDWLIRDLAKAGWRD